MPDVHPTVSTYRLQFNGEFRFKDAAAVVPYLSALGITDVYASPLFQAKSGSLHGYDVIDPTRLSSDLGGEPGFALLSESLWRHNMGLLLDIVPNHMAADSENPWWRDVLRHGQNSPYAAYFDIDWRPLRPGLHGKVLLPILGAPYGTVLKNNELRLQLAEDGLWLTYGEMRLPITPASCRRVLMGWVETLLGSLGDAHPAAGTLRESLDLPDEMAARELWRLSCTFPKIKAFVEEHGGERTPEEMDCLLSEQPYRLAYWRSGMDDLNYRRFFNVSDLVCVRMESKKVFEDAHGLVRRLVTGGRVTGLRIDHVDGLWDPGVYIRSLQERLGDAGPCPGLCVVVEKILGKEEELPPDWLVDGTTGYDFLNAVNALFVDPQGADDLDILYARCGGGDADFGTVVYAQKKRVTHLLFASELRTLTWRLGLLAEADRQGRDLTLRDLEQALVEMTACLPVYRTYINDFRVADRDRDYIEGALRDVLSRCPGADMAVSFLRRILLLEFPPDFPATGRQEWLDFVMRWQQFTGPVMAKGFEDTALYIYNRLVSLNEVGGDPQMKGVTPAAFHQYNNARLEQGRPGLSATSTHDNKRSEDVRARINVLSEIAGAWARRVALWKEWNAGLKPVVGSSPAPDENTELLIYQTLVGAWPLREEDVPAFKERLAAYLVKAAREAKVYTRWFEPNQEYEQAVQAFAAAILEPGPKNQFLQDFKAFQDVTAFYGALNSLAQVLLKVASPGVPDFYQGTELWDFSLVDPDNRRPVNFSHRQELLTGLRDEISAGRSSLAKRLLGSWKDGRVKLYLTHQALRFRQAHPELFSHGDYLPVDTVGSGQEHLCAFARRWEGHWALAVVPRLVTRLQMERLPRRADELPAMAFPLGKTAWGETAMVLPQDAPDRWHNVLIGERVGGRVLYLHEVLKRFPVALLKQA